MTYEEQFPAGTRVVIRCSEPGTDRLMHNKAGEVVRYWSAGFLLIRFDETPRYGNNPRFIGASHVRHEQ